MAEPNPHRQIARAFAFICYILSGFALLVGAFFTLAAAMVDATPPELGGITNRQMAFMFAGLFLIIVVMIALFGWRIQTLFGQHHRQEKLIAKSWVGCLRLGSLGCGLWSLLAICITALTGKRLLIDQPSDFSDIFVGASSSALAIFLMLAVAWFISSNYVRPKPEERGRAFHIYREDIKSRLLKLAEPETRAYVQEQTMEVLTKLDAPLKSALLRFLSESGLLAGHARIALRGADFRRIDLRSISLPRADLHEINLEQSTLQGAILYEANLHKANLKKADLSHVNLQGANLQQADLTEAILTGSNVTLKQLEQAHLKKTVLPDGKLSH